MRVYVSASQRVCLWHWTGTRTVEQFFGSSYCRGRPEKSTEEPFKARVFANVFVLGVWLVLRWDSARQPLDWVQIPMEAY